MPVQNNTDNNKNELQKLEKLFLNSNNEIKVTREMAISTDGMCDDIS